MASNFQTLRTTTFALGLDQESSENRIAEGYVEDIENANPQPTGQISKREGYQGYAGNLPVRISEIRQTSSPNDLCFILPSGIDLSNVASSPIVVEGRQLSAGTGDFPANVESTSQYYSGFTIDIRRTFTAGTHTDSFLQTDHNLSGPIIWGGVAASDSLFNASNTQFFLDSYKINESTEDIDYTYTNGTGSDFTGFVYLKNAPDTAGVFYNHTPTSVSGSGTTTIVIPLSTHGLNNNNILVKLFRDNNDLTVPENKYEEITPDSVTISSGGTVTVVLTNTSTDSWNIICSLWSVPTANFLTGASSGTSAIVQIDISQGTAYPFVGCYQQVSTDLQQVLPDSVVIDTVAQLATVTFTTTEAANFRVFWDFGNIVANRLCVTPNNAAADITDVEPQITIWGLDHSEIYGTNRVNHDGWVNHIDSYKSTGENRLVAGIGGGIYSAQLYEEGTNASTHLLPELYPSIQNVLNADITIGPAFIDNSDVSVRSRGYIKGDNGASNYFTVDTVGFDTGTGWVKYTLNVPNMVIFGTLSTIISTTTGLEDYLTTDQCGWAGFNGSFKIRQVTQVDSSTLDIYVENSSITTTDFNESDVGGFAGIFTDRITFTGSAIPRFVTGDILLSGLFDENDAYTVINSQVLSGTPTTTIRNVISEVTLPITLKVTAIRTSYVMPLRNLNATQSTVTNLVRGDMLVYSEINRLLRIKSINTLTDTAITISTIPGNTTEVSVTGISTSGLALNQKLLFLGMGNYNGTQQVSNIISTSEFYISSNITPVSDSGTLIGKTIEIDELLTFRDTETSLYGVYPHARFIPIEFPTDSYNATIKTRPQYFQANTYGNQPIIRSTMVQDNMYLTNYDDEVMKFDGVNLYRAGLFRWQPNLFMSVDTSVTGKIAISTPSITTSAAATQNTFYTTIVNQNVFAVGDIIRNSADGEDYTIRSIAIDAGSQTKINVDRVITTTTIGSTLTRVAYFKYYFRLNAVDANNNIVASAVTGSQDSVARLTADAGVRIRLVGMPIWDIYDYERLEVQIYRTKANQVAPFYRLTTLQMKFDSNNGYIDYTDHDSDATLVDLDEVNTALKGSELGTAWEQPLRAKYVTSAGNRLILGNLSGYPQLDIQLLKNNSVLTASTFTTSGNDTWLFKKDNTDTGTTSDMLNRAIYEFRGTASAVNITGATSITSSLFTLSVVNTAVAGDWVYLYHDSTHTSNQNLRFSGWWQLTSRTAGTITITNVNSDVSAFAAGTDVIKCMFASTSGNVPVVIGTDYNYNQFNGNRTGASDSYEYLAVKRLAEAINASMRKCITSEFHPWMIAAAGNEIGNAKLIVRNPKAGTTFLEIKLPALTGAFDVFVNNVRRAASTEASATTNIYPSRVIMSYPNYPEIFDAPEATVDADSDSAIDINSADGQEITAIIPFFGDSAFGAALKSGVVVVFKTNSIYLVDIAAKAAGSNPVQKIESMGKGCTAPYSVAVTKNGIMFANESGIYRLTRDMQVQYVGRKYGRLWREGLNRTEISTATGTHDPDANAYKLSYPTGTSTENSLVAVYSHTTEEVTGMYGSWTRYTNHNATGWANLLAQSYFGSVLGRVLSLRKLGETSDYRDDSAAIEMAITLAAQDFGDSGRRKFVKYLTTHYRGLANTTGTTLQTALDLADNFTDTDGFDINKTPSSTGIGDSGDRKVVTIQSSLQGKKGVYFQAKFVNSTIDEPVEITGVDYTVTGLNERGINQAAQTR